MYEIGSREYEMYNSILIVARYELSLRDDVLGLLIINPLIAMPSYKFCYLGIGISRCCSFK